MPLQYVVIVEASGFSLYSVAMRGAGIAVDGPVRGCFGTRIIRADDPEEAEEIAICRDRDLSCQKRTDRTIR
jgi:hypothetical protein